MNKSKKVQILINIVAVILIVFVCLMLYIYFKDDIKLLFSTKDGLDLFIEKIEKTGVFGALILILIQTMQVIVAFIPGEVVEIASGIMFGPFLGMLICLIGLNVGTIAIFGLVKLFGKPFVKENVKEKNHKYLKLLDDPDKALVILFLIFLIPGIPKDILIYLVPLTKIKMSKFLIVSSIARIPSIISSTFVGSSIINGDYLVAGIISGICLLLAILGFIFSKQIFEFLDKRKKQN